MRNGKAFPLDDNPILAFLKRAWDEGLLDEYSDDHFLIRAIENRLDDFVGRIQLTNNNWTMYCPCNAKGEYDLSAFSYAFCINLSIKLAGMAQAFGENAIKRFITDQLSAGKQNNYNEDTFLQALSEISILTFWLSRCHWDQTVYEPRVNSGVNNKNPEASFIVQTEGDPPKTIKINIEVKSPKFPHDNHENEKILIPSVLLTEQGRNFVPNFCSNNGIRYLDPRVGKLIDFINSAASKFDIPSENELNLLYINWSYRDFPSNGFLEAASLLSNSYNGLLFYPNTKLPKEIVPDAFQKISAIIVYTESLEGVMFTDFRHVWQQNGAGPRFRMYTLDHNIKQNVYDDTREFIYQLTGMNPCERETRLALIDLKIKTAEDRRNAVALIKNYQELIKEDVILPGNVVTQ